MYLILIFSTWYLYHITEYCFHRLGHSRIYGGHIYKLHMNHHRIHYPITQLKAPMPYKAGNEYYFSDGVVAYLPPSILIAHISCVSHTGSTPAFAARFSHITGYFRGHNTRSLFSFRQA